MEHREARTNETARGQCALMKQELQRRCSFAAQNAFAAFPITYTEKSNAFTLEFSLHKYEFGIKMQMNAEASLALSLTN